MRIAHFVFTFGKVSEIWLYNYINELQRQGTDNHVLTAVLFNQNEWSFENLHLYNLSASWTPAQMFKRVRKWFGALPEESEYIEAIRPWLRERIFEIQPDIVQAHFAPQAVTIAPITTELNIPLIAGFYGYDIARLPRQQFWKERYHEITNQVARFIAPSRFVCNKLEDFGYSRQKIHLQHWGINLDMFKYSDPAQRFDGRTIQCLHIGRLVEKKSPIKLVKAFNLARKSLNAEYNLQLQIAGDGPLMEDLLTTITDLRLSDCVDVLGSVSNDEVHRLMQTAHIYTQFSQTATNGDQEAQGLSFVEASASGLPILSTKHNGIPDVVLDGKTGYLVPEGDYQAMGLKLIDLCQDSALWTQFGKAGREHIEREFSLPIQVKKARDLFEEILSEK